MRTEDIKAKGPSDWRPEPDQKLLAAIGKLGEEAGELASRCSRAMIQGALSLDPSDGRPNAIHIEDEIADVYATAEIVTRLLGLDPAAIVERSRRKRDFKQRWLDAFDK